MFLNILTKSNLILLRNLIIICLIFISCDNGNRKNSPIAVDGILNLTDWNFEQDGNIALTGPWKYVWMHDSPDFSKEKCDVSGWKNILVPATWKSTVNESYGYGWLRLTIILNTDEPLRAYLKNTIGSSALFCNANEIITNGITSNSKEDFFPMRKGESALLPKGDTLVLAWKIVNYDDVYGGPRHPVVIGRDKDVLSSVIIKDYQNILIFGIIFIMFLYHTLLWSRRPKDLTSLFFGLFCLVILIRLFITDIILASYLNLPNFYYIWRTIELLTLPIACIMFLFFIAGLFPNESSRRLIKILIILSAALIIPALINNFTRTQLFNGMHYIHEALLLSVITVCLTILIKAIINKRTYSKLVLIGFLILGISVITDIYYYNSPHGHRFVVYTGLVLFIIIQSIILSFKFADAHNTAEHLTEHLKEEVDRKTNAIKSKSDELEKINLELKKADEYKTRFFQNITHEFKTPLTLITGPAQSILNNYYGIVNDAVRKQIEIIKQNGLNTLNLVNQLLELARSDNKQIKLKLTKSDINEVLRTILANFESLATRNNIKLSFIADSSSVSSFIDREKFERIFFNLLSNSFKFTNENGQIQITLKYKENAGEKKYVIVVKDTGRGILKENIPFIFNRFYKLYSPEISDIQGTGIGLTLVKEYTIMHAGSVDVSSTPGSGTVFTLIFPIIETDEEISEYFKSGNSILEIIKDQTNTLHIDKLEIEHYVHSARDMYKSAFPVEGESPEIFENSNKTLLIVEDNNDMRAYIKDILKNSYKILEAKNGEKGFEVVIDKMPDLIISDVMMPKMNGIELCKKIKTDIRTEHIPVILLTARSASSDSLEGYLTGADDYISKPFSRELLSIRIQNLIESRNKLRDHYKTRFLMEPENTLVESNVEKFINRAVKAIECNISDPDYNIEQFASELGISPAQLYRKLISVVGHSPAEFIRIVRLKRSAKILEESIEKDINVSEIAFDLGFANHSHFSHLFKKHYGISPTEYAKKFQ